MVNSLTNAIQFGLRDKMVNGKKFEIVVPLYSELMAAGAGENVQGVIGSMNWNWQLQDAGSKAFVKSFGEKYGRPPSNSAHTCYVQTCFMQTPVSARAPSTLAALAKLSKALSLTVLAMAQHRTAPTTTSASKTFWL